METASTPSWARRRVIVFGGATWRGRHGVVVGKGWTRMIVDGRVGAEVRCRESRQDRRPGEFEEVKESSACKLAR
jgi:hypothetical protein